VLLHILTIQKAQVISHKYLSIYNLSSLFYLAIRIYFEKLSCSIKASRTSSNNLFFIYIFLLQNLNALFIFFYSPNSLFSYKIFIILYINHYYYYSYDYSLVSRTQLNFYWNLPNSNYFVAGFDLP
jgi:hypothetical protein